MKAKVKVHHGRINFVNPMLDCRNIALLGTGMCEIFRVTQDDLLEAGYKIEIIDRADLYIDPAPEPVKAADLAMLLGLGMCPVEVLTLNMRDYLDEQIKLLPVKNSQHSNDPWRRKQWRHR